MKRALIIFITISLLAVLPTAIFGTNVIKTLSINDGMTQNNVKAILRDTRGFLWLGTKYGLNRYDLENLINYYASEATNTISDNDIQVIHEGADGRIYVAGRRGVAVYDYSSGNFEQLLSPEGKYLNIRSIHSTPSGLLMGGAGRLYFYDYDKGTVSEMPTPGGSQMFYSKILPWTGGRMLLVTRWDGIYIYDTKTKQTQPASFISDKEISASEIDKNGSLWIAPYGKGLYRYSPEGELTKIIKLSDYGVPSEIVLDLLVDGDRMWFATDGGGIGTYDFVTQDISRVYEAHNDRLMSVNKLYIDNYDNLYAGTVRDGAAIIHSTAMNTYTHTQSDEAVLAVTSIIRVGDEVYYGCDGAGVVVYDKEREVFNTIPSTAGMKVTCMAPLGSKRLLLSTFDRGFYELNLVTLRLEPAGRMFERIFQNNYRKAIALEMRQLDAGRLAILSDSVYIVDLNAGTSHTFDVHEGRRSGRMSPFAYQDEMLFAATESTIEKIDTRAGKSERIYSVESGNSINDATLDNRGHIYIGEGNVLKLIDSATGRDSTLAILPQRINSLTYDDGYLWIGIFNTLMQYDLTTGVTTIYNRYDGVKPNEFVTRAKLTDSDEIQLGGINGLLIIDKAALSEMMNAAHDKGEIHLSSLNIDGVASFGQVHDKQIILPHNHSSIDLGIIEIGSDSFRNKNFRFTVSDGKHENVIESRSRRVQLGKLNSGKTYSIAVSTSGLSGNWTEPVEILKIKVERPMWLSWWAVLVYIIVTAVAAWFTYLYITARKARINQLKKHHQLEKEVGFLVNINQELRTPLSMIYGPMRKLGEQLERTGTDKHVAKVINKALLQIEKMHNVINLSMEKWRSNALEVAPEMARHDINALLRNIAAEYIGSAVMKGMSFDMYLSANECMAVYDNTRMNIVFNNIFINLLKLNPEGVIIKVDEHADDNKIEVGITARDSDFDPVQIDEIFNTYGPEDSNHFGTGLGLAYAKLLVETQDDTIVAKYDEATKSLTVSVTLAAAGDEDVESTSADSSVEGTNDVEEKIEHPFADFDASKLTVLISDSETELCAFIASELQNTFGQVLTCNNSRDAFIMVRNAQPDIIISGENKLCAKVKKSDDLRHIPIVLLTPGKNENEAEEAYRTGADAVLSKPFDINVLLLMLSNLLSSRSIMRNRYSREPNHEDAPQRSNADESFLLHINEIIRDNIQSHDFSVNIIVEQLLMSRSVVYSRFSELTGKTLGAYVNEYKLERAKHMLTDQTVSINEISDALGFNNQRYFATFFKQHTGMSPTQYRNEYKNNAQHD